LYEAAGRTPNGDDVEPPISWRQKEESLQKTLLGPRRGDRWPFSGEPFGGGRQPESSSVQRKETQDQQINWRHLCREVWGVGGLEKISKAGR